jgi:hypothetical protein
MPLIASAYPQVIMTIGGLRSPRMRPPECRLGALIVAGIQEKLAEAGSVGNFLGMCSHGPLMSLQLGLNLFGLDGRGGSR